MASQLTTNIIKIGEPVDILYGRLSQEDDHAGDSNSIVNQELLCKGWFLPPNTDIPPSAGGAGTGEEHP